MKKKKSRKAKKIRTAEAKVRSKEQEFPGGFEGCVRVMSQRPGVEDPEALCAFIGRRAGKIPGSEHTKEQITDPQPELFRQFDEEWCLLEPDGSKGKCFASREEAEEAARKMLTQEAKRFREQEEEFIIRTSPDPRDGHVHEVVELDEEGNGKTSEASGEQSEPHSHDIADFEVQPMEAADGSYTSEHPGSLPTDMKTGTEEAAHGDECPSGMKRDPETGECVKIATESDTLIPFLARESLTGRFTERGPLDDKGKIWEVVLIKAGMSKNGRLYSREVLRDAVERKIFEGLPAFAFVYRTPDGLILDHAPDGVSTSNFPKDVAGFYKDVRFDESSGEIVGQFHFVDPVLQTKHKEAFDAGNKNLFGLSIDAIGEGEQLTKDTVEIKYFVRASSDDLVSAPAAGGRFIRMVASLAKRRVLKEDGKMDKRKLLLQLIMEVKPDLLEGKDTATITLEELQTMIAGEEFVEIRKAFAELATAPSTTPPPPTASQGDAPNVAQTQPAAAAVETEKLINEAAKRARESILKEEWPGRVEAAIKEAKLPEEAAKMVRDLAEKNIGDGAHLSSCVGRAQKLLESAGWPDSKLGSVRVAEGVEKKWSRAIEASVNGRPGADGVPAFRNFRHALQTMTGKTEWSSGEMMRMLAASMGRICAHWNDYRVGDGETKPMTEAYTNQLREASRSWFGSVRETVDVAQFAELFGDSVTRQMIEDYTLPSLNDWRAVVSKVSNLEDLRTSRRVRVGQYGNAATVAEGAAYGVATTPGDEEVTYTLTKRGDVETITEEAMLQDDLGQLASIPRRMTRGLLQQIRKVVWDLINPTVNAAIFDAAAIFQIAGLHANAVNGTLTLANLNSIRSIMRKKTAFGGATHELGTIPKFMIVPPELENAANQFSSSQFEPSSNLFQVANLHRGIGVIVLDHFTDADAVVLVGDPSQIPTIEVGAIGGKIEPELFTQDNPTTGSFFDTDSVKIKRKSRFGAAVLEFRGIAALFPGLV